MIGIGRRPWILAAALMILVARPGVARADGFLGGGIGSVTGGSLGASSRTFTVDFGAMSHTGWVGVEGDYGVSSAILGGTRSRTLSASLLIGPRLRGVVRPYGSIGAGVLGQSLVFSDTFKVIGQNPPQRDMLTFGGGVMALISKHVGIDVDVRIFRDLQAASATDPSHVHFARLTGGVFLGF